MVRYNNIDTSQHQNFQRFRNELKNEAKFVITSKLFENVRTHREAGACSARTAVKPAAHSGSRSGVTQLPNSGTFEFDYVQAKRASRRSKPLTWERLLALCLKSGMHVVLEMAAMEINERHVTTNDPVPFMFDHLSSDLEWPDWAGPPEFLSALSTTPNEYPVPPYRTRCAAAPVPRCSASAHPTSCLADMCHT